MNDRAASSGLGQSSDLPVKGVSGSPSAQSGSNAPSEKAPTGRSDTFPTPRDTKAALRAEIRAALKAISPDARRLYSIKACERMAVQDVWKRASRILGYAPRPDELDVSLLLDAALREGKVVALPQFEPKTGLYRAARIDCPLSELSPGYLGIREPGELRVSVPLKQLDLILAPGVAFDLAGRRLGRGRGFYDRLMEGVPGKKCGVAFEEQIRAAIPVESHDVLLDCLLTPARWVGFDLRGRGDELVG